MKVSYGAISAAAVGRKPALVNGSLLEAKRNASHPSFVNFGFAAIADTHWPFESVDDPKDAIL